MSMADISDREDLQDVKVPTCYVVGDDPFEIAEMELDVVSRLAEASDSQFLKGYEAALRFMKYHILARDIKAGEESL